MTAEAIRGAIVPLTYLFSSSLFIFGLKRLGRVQTARSGNVIAALAMLLAVLGTLVELGLVDYRWIVGGVVLGALIGTVAAARVPMTAMPEMVALFNGFGGAASALVSVSIVWSVLIEPGAGVATRRSAVEALGAASATSSAISVLVGGLTFTGSLIAFLKLRGSLAGGRAVIWPARHALNALLAAGALAAAVVLVGWAAGASAVAIALLVLTAVALVLGATLVLPIGGADMPVVVSLLNSYSGVAAAAAGFVIGNPALVVAGAMVGAAGLILTNLMCKAMNRSLVSVLVGGFGMEATEAGGGEYVGVKSATPEEAAMVLEAARSVILVPGYGLAVAQAQHAVRELSEELRRRGIEVRYAIHPVAGRMPGHMNVLLAEADVPYEQLFERDAIDQDFRATDVAIVVGANDVVNPAAIEDPKSPIYGMPILSVHEARTVFVIKRSLASGYAGIKNALFERDNTSMIFGDARQVVQGMVTALREGT